MKFVIGLAVLASAVTFVSAGCRSGSSNKPNCDVESDPEKKYQNDYDAKSYFYCESGVVKEGSCGDQCFYGTGSKCVPCNPKIIHRPECTETVSSNKVAKQSNEVTEQQYEPRQSEYNATPAETEAVTTTPNHEVTEQGYESSTSVTYTTQPETETFTIKPDNEVTEQQYEPRQSENNATQAETEAGCRSGTSNRPNCEVENDPKKKYQNDYDAKSYFYCDGGVVKEGSCGDQCFYKTGSTDCVPCDLSRRHTPECTNTKPKNRAAEKNNKIIQQLYEHEQTESDTEPEHLAA